MSRRVGWVKLDVEKAGALSARLRDFLYANIKGQDAVKDVADAMEIHAGELQEDDKPIYKGLFLGPSGVGKTLMAEMLAMFFFGNRRAFTRIACETYSEKHSIAKLIGSPPGYVGYGEPPILSQDNIDKWAIPDADRAQLKKNADFITKTEKDLKDTEDMIFRILWHKFNGTPPPGITPEMFDAQIENDLKAQYFKRNGLMNKLEALRLRSAELKVENPLSIILFDEGEKASPELHNIILNILDKAEITCSNGDVTHFNNTIILMTSNAGSTEIADKVKKSRRRSIGFHDEKNEGPRNSDQDIYEVAMDAANRQFSPEFLARFDRISVFRHLSKEVLAQIYDLELSNFCKKYLVPVSITLDIASDARQFIIDEATDKPERGARLIKQKILKYLYRQIARLKNRHELMTGDTLHVVLVKSENGGKPVLEYYRETPSASPSDDDTSPTV